MEALFLGWRSLLLGLIALHLAIAAVLLVLRRYDQAANRYLALLLLVVIGYFTPQIIGFAGFYDRWPQLSFTPFALDLYIGPLIWAYSWALMRGGQPWPGFWLWIPGTAELVYGLVLMVQPLPFKDAWADGFHAQWVVPVEEYGGLLLMIAGFAASARLYRRYRGWLRDHSAAAEEFDPRWLPGFLAAITLVVITAAGADLADAVFGPLSYLQAFPSFILAGVIFYGLALGALMLHRSAVPKMSDTANTDPVPEAGRDWAAEARRLRERILADNLHLEPRLTAPELARHVGTNETYLSRTVNIGAGQNFNRFINEIRVERVKAELAGGAEDILRTALDCGFNSKATFNRVFREIAGETPAAFRRNARASAPSETSQIQ